MMLYFDLPIDELSDGITLQLVCDIHHRNTCKLNLFRIMIATLFVTLHNHNAILKI